MKKKFHDGEVMWKLVGNMSLMKILILITSKCDLLCLILFSV